MEALFLLVWKKRQIIFVAQSRAIAQASIGGKEAEEAFKDFIKQVTQKQDSKHADKLRDRLTAMKKITAIKVTPLEGMTKTKHIRRVTR